MKLTDSNATAAFFGQDSQHRVHSPSMKVHPKQAPCNPRARLHADQYTVNLSLGHSGRQQKHLLSDLAT